MLRPTWTRWLGKLFAPPSDRRRLRTVLGVTPLEDRTVPAAIPLTGPNGGAWVKVDTLTVATRTNQNVAAGVTSNVVLDAGVNYLAVASGTARIATDSTGFADAEYIRYNKSTGPQDGSSPGYAWNNHGVRIAGVDGGDTTGNFWGEYQTDHQYVRDVVGQGTQVTGWYSDIPGYYGDNSGTLTVDLYEEEFVNHPPVVVVTAGRTDREDDEIGFTVQASDPDGDSITFSAAGLPDGVLMDPATGMISGRLSPTSAGSYHPMVSVTDYRGAETSVTFDWTVTDHNHAPYIIEAAPTTPFTVGQTLTGLNFFTATDPDGDPLTITVPDLPSWLTFDPDSGTVSGTIAEAGTVSVTVIADDGHGGVASETFPLLTASAPYAYFTTEGPLATFVDPGTPLTLDVVFANPGGDPDQEFEVVVHASGRGTVDQPILSLHDGETATVTYTPASVSEVYNDIRVTLATVIPVTQVQTITAQIQITNVTGKWANPINAANTPQFPVPMAARIPLGGNGFSTHFITTPGLPQGTVVFGRNQADPKYGDVRIQRVDANFAGAGTGTIRVSVFGSSPTLPGVDAQGKQDYKASNVDGLWLIPSVTNPGQFQIDGPASSRFAVATIPIAVRVERIDPNPGTWGAVPGAMNAQGEQLGSWSFGVKTYLGIVYDGEAEVFNSNYTGEWLARLTTEGTIPEGDLLELRGTTNRVLFQQRTTAEKLQANLPGPQLMDDTNGGASPAEWLNTLAGRNGAAATLSMFAENHSGPVTPRSVAYNTRSVQMFTYINTALTPVDFSTGATVNDPGAPTIRKIENLPFNKRYIIKNSYYNISEANIRQLRLVAVGGVLPASVPVASFVVFRSLLPKVAEWDRAYPSHILDSGEWNPAGTVNPFSVVRYYAP
ncbi:putative Ig domain-containing protein [Gemmata sp.]|uniref:putative Ig domain-containing protein n=1 Tax=Gemmata sp. TaxID=1914242 RepID=UPI003F730487